MGREARQHLCGYQYGDLYDRIATARTAFCIGTDLAAVEQCVRNMAAEADRVLDCPPCECGGRISLAAPPRCPYCHSVVLEGAFHTTASKEAVADWMLTREEALRLWEAAQAVEPDKS
ncbi:hypothetical protein [Tahibacter amnicola]|uniref:Uncharacterized protein n=1 Tax=Tahibacter amnicola TaxID=2976241 RepID=A0ABY6BBB6_9GAMM|nr:hypothetical protein [Tahibacter amnicola]UXI67154.1 hypothetical protein N4264_20780 [Tahibacter amnicola]